MRLSCLSPLHRTIPGDNMDNTSMENPFKKLLSVAQTNLDWPGSLSLFGQNTGQKRKGQKPFGFCPVYGACIGPQVALQRCPTLHTSSTSLPFLFSVLDKGDISTLQIRGHFYFALTPFVTGFCDRADTQARADTQVDPY